jgi:hypothetical protein
MPAFGGFRSIGGMVRTLYGVAGYIEGISPLHNPRIRLILYP